ncbi:MAG TPA: hypothetical protein PKY77_05150 [Phycisphaerae bacterium]|nr:hypothetical protein [Phycisphaerae bacterium]HRY68901.1 hypothetical protein [Phycisphaerae bacterium]HSA25728.1 hypothetical protein [Phycisphaerae bacterium]
MRPVHHTHTRRGRLPATNRWAFTLAEVLATLMLVGIVLPVVMRGISVALAAASHARYLAQATSLGEAKLTELVTTGDWLLAQTSGDFGLEWPQYRWSCQNFTRDFSMDELVLRVTWTERGQERTLDLATLTFDTGSLASTTDETGTSGATGSSGTGGSGGARP